MSESNRLTVAERLAQLRNRAEDALERIEEKWDKAMDAFHGRPIRDPQAEAAAELSAEQGYGIFTPRESVKIAGLEFDREPMAGGVGPVHVRDEEYGQFATLPASMRTLDDAISWMESDAGRAAVKEAGRQWSEYLDSPAGRAEAAAAWAESQERDRVLEREDRARLADEHEPTTAELAQNEEYERAMWPDLEEDEPELDPVRTISEGEWLVPEAGVETRLHLGQSDDGFHYYVETSRSGGDDGGPYWSQAYPTREMADDAGSRRLHETHYSQEHDIMKPDGLSALDSKSRELVAAAASAIEKVDWFYDRSPDPTVRSEGFKHMRAAVHSLDAVVTHGDNLRVEYAMDAVDAIKQHTLRTEAASAIWQHHAPKMASETKEYYRPDWFYPERLHNHSWDVGKIADMGQEYRPQGHQPAQILESPLSAGRRAQEAADIPEREVTEEATAQIRAPLMVQENGLGMTSSDDRTYLAVPFDEKDDAKQLGAKWDSRGKAWYVPAGMDLQAFEPWLPAKGEVQIAVEADPREEFATVLRECGLQVEGLPVMNGQLQRVAVEGDRGKQRSGAYFGHLDGKPAGFIENFRTGVRTNWKTSGQVAALGAQDRAQMAAEAAQKRHERALERERQYERSAQEVDAIWTAATPVEAHPYLAEKGVPSDGLRLADDGRLLVPVQDSDGKLWSLQYIAPDGSKLFHEGGRVEGGHYAVGDVDRPGPLLIAEGYATAATLYGLSDMPSIVAFNAGNLASVAQTYRALYPERDIYIAGDNDHRREAEGKPNVGREKAEEAAAKIGSSALLPTFAENDAGSDWNDLARSQGKDEARLQFKIAVAIAERETLARELSATRERDSGCEKTLACSHGLRQTRSEELELER